jgi:hypothetical protein
MDGQFVATCANAMCVIGASVFGAVSTAIAYPSRRAFRSTRAKRALQRHNSALADFIESFRALRIGAKACLFRSARTCSTR